MSADICAKLQNGEAERRDICETRQCRLRDAVSFELQICTDIVVFVQCAFCPGRMCRIQRFSEGNNISKIYCQPSPNGRFNQNKLNNSRPMKNPMKKRNSASRERERERVPSYNIRFCRRCFPPHHHTSST